MKYIIDQVISALKNSEQDLVFLDSAICPIRSIVGWSKGDQIMHEVYEELERRQIVVNALGYMTNVDSRPGQGSYLYHTSFTLNENWFQVNCRPRKKHFHDQLDFFPDVH